MIKSYIKVALRGFRKNKLISFINIFGLGLSMSVGMMVMIRLQDQFSYDKFHPHPERTYRIISNYSKKTGEHWKMASTPLPLNDKIQRVFGSVESSVNVYPALNGKAIAAGKEIYLNSAFTEPSFFKVFGFSLASGNDATALEKPNTIVISQNTAKKYFGAEDPMGKVISMETGANFIITGVLRENPGKSHVSYDAFASFTSVQQLEKDKILDDKSSDWYAFNTAYTYVVLKANYTVSGLRNELSAVSKDLNRQNKEGISSFTIQALNKITPGSDYLYNDIGRGGSWTKFYFETGIALIILLAACFNYTNLTIARSLTRAKEVGIRKVTGAKRSQVFVQYIIESVLLCFLALMFAWTLLAFIIRYAPFNDDYEFIPSTFQYNMPLFLWSIGFALFTALLAGAAPAWILSSFKPLRVLKNLVTARIMGKVSIQKTLIVFQYSLSLTIIIFLLAFYRQFSYMAGVDPGYKRDHVLVVPLNGLDKAIAAEKISEISGVLSVGAMSASFTKHVSGMNSPAWMNNKKEAVTLNYYFADEAFIRGMHFSMVTGNNFPGSAEKKDEQYILINESAAMAFGLKDFQKAIGQSIWINDSTRLQITGVMKNFSYENVGVPVQPLAMRIKQNAYNYLYVSTDPTDKNVLMDRVNMSLKSLMPSQTFSSFWLDEELARNNSQVATISLLGYLAFMAIAIASLGLLGLVIYTVEVKRKEISIRKIIGAGEKQLVRMLSKGFIKLLLIAGLIAMPLGYTASFLFLQNFLVRVNFGFSVVLLCFLFVLSIGLITIITQTYKAATANPVKDLRME